MTRKQLLGIICADEIADLEQRKSHYSEEEYDQIVVRILGELEGQLPKDPLDDWMLDYLEIKYRGEAIRRRGKIKRYSTLGYAATLLLIIGGMLLYFFYPHKKEDVMLHLESPCLGSADDAEIPSIEPSCLLLAADSTWIRIGQDSFGKIIQVGELAVSRDQERLLHIQRKQLQRGHLSKLNSLDIYTAPRQQCVVELEDVPGYR